jgi:uncharacterized membrane protein YecN with MAPEG domain
MVVSLYASLLAIIFVFLSVLVIKARISAQVAIGSGGSKLLEQRIRAHANFSEYTTFVLVLLFMAEYQAVSGYITHILGILFLTGRISHLYSLVFHEKYEDGRLKTSLKYRQIGMFCTFTTISLCSVINLVLYLTKIFS